MGEKPKNITELVDGKSKEIAGNVRDEFAKKQKDKVSVSLENEKKEREDAVNKINLILNGFYLTNLDRADALDEDLDISNKARRKLNELKNSGSIDELVELEKTLKKDIERLDKKRGVRPENLVIINSLNKKIDALFAHNNFVGYIAEGKNRKRIENYKKDIKEEVKKKIESGETNIDVAGIAVEYANNRGAKKIAKIIGEVLEEGKEVGKKESGELERKDAEALVAAEIPASELPNEEGEEKEILTKEKKEEILKGVRTTKQIRARLFAMSEEEQKRVFGSKKSLRSEVKRIKKDLSMKKEGNGKRKKPVAVVAEEDEKLEKGSLVEDSTEGVSDKEVLTMEGDKGEGSGEIIDVDFEVIEEEREINDEKLKELSRNLEEARKIYLEKDYETKKKASSIRGFFGRAIGLNNIEEELKEYEDNYRIALKEYGGAIVSSGELEKGGELDAESAEIMIRYYEKSEILRIENDKANLRIEKNPRMEGIKRFWNDTVKDYKDLSLKRKIFYGVALGAASVAAGISGGLAAGAVAGAAVYFKRAISTAGAVLGTSMALDAKEKMAEEKMIKARADLVNESGADEKYDYLNTFLNKEINTVGERLREREIKRTKNILKGIRNAVLIYGAFSLVGEAAEWASENEAVKSVISGFKDMFKSDPEEIAAVNNEIRSPEKIVPTQTEAIHGSGLHSGPTVAETSPLVEESKGVSERAVEAATMTTLPENGKIDLNIEKGSSIEKTLKEFLMENKDEFTEGKMGWSEDKFANVDDWAGRRAHVIAQEFAEGKDYNFDKVSVGSTLGIDFSNPEDIKIVDFNDPNNLGEVAKSSTGINSDVKPEDLGVKQEHSIEEFKKYGAKIFNETGSDTEINSDVKPEDLGVKQEHSIEEFKKHGAKIFSETDSSSEMGPETGSGKITDEELKMFAPPQNILGESFRDPQPVDSSPIENSTDENSTESSKNSEADKKVVQKTVSQQESSAERGLAAKIRQEMMLAKSFGLSSEEYSAIDDVPIAKLIQEIPAEDDESWKQYKSANSYSPDLPADGARGWSEFKKQESLANFFRAYNESNLPKVDGSMTIGEFFRQVDLNSLTENDTFRLDTSDLDFKSDESYESYIQKFTETEILEVRKMIVRADLNVWRELRGKLIKDVDNESFRNAYEKVNKLVGLKDVRGENVERWTTRIARAVYEQGRASEAKEILKTVTNGSAE